MKLILEVFASLAFLNYIFA